MSKHKVEESSILGKLPYHTNAAVIAVNPIDYDQLLESCPKIKVWRDPSTGEFRVKAWDLLVVTSDRVRPGAFMLASPYYDL